MSVQSSATVAPASMVAGRSRLWLLVLSTNRAMWGTTSPMKLMGPQNAVTPAVRMPVMMSRELRVRLVLTPKFSA